MPKIARELTNIEVKHLSKVVGTHSVGRVPGLTLRVSKGVSGGFRALWILRIRGADTQRSLGKYPDVSLGLARELAVEYLKQVKAGQIPLRKKTISPVAEETIVTFGEAFIEWKGNYIKSANKPEQAEIKARYVERYLFEALQDCDIKGLKTKDIGEAIAPIWLSKSATCRKISQALGVFFGWCYLNKEYRDSDTNIGSQRLLGLYFGKDSVQRKQAQNHPYIEPIRIPELVRSVFIRGEVTDYALIFTIMSALRNGNGRSVRWDQIKEIEYQGVSYPVIEFDKEEMKVSKNGQHLVPLSKEHQAILTIMRGFKTASNPHVFPGRSDGGKLSDSALKLSIKASNEREIQAGRAGWIDPVTNRVAVPHALARACFETWAVQNRVDKRVIELIQHHAVSDYNGAYDRDITLDEKFKVMQQWAGFCCSLIADDLEREANRIEELLSS